MIYPQADYRPVKNHGGKMRQPIMGIVVHHTVGSLDAAENRFNTPSAQSSAHFGVGFDGLVRQWVDVDVVAYHACAANYNGWVGVEHESSADPDHLWEPLTDAQVVASGGILKWLHDEAGVLLQVTDDINVGGVAYHAMDPGDCSTHWGQTGCPGDAIITQRQAIVDAASGSTPLLSTGDDMPIRRLTEAIPAIGVAAGSLWAYTATRWDAIAALSPGVVAQDIGPAAFMAIRDEQDQLRNFLKNPVSGGNASGLLTVTSVVTSTVK